MNKIDIDSLISNISPVIFGVSFGVLFFVIFLSLFVYDTTPIGGWESLYKKLEEYCDTIQANRSDYYCTGRYKVLSCKNKNRDRKIICTSIECQMEKL